MKAVLFSLLLAVILAVAPTNTEDIRDPRQTRTQCERMIEDKEEMIRDTWSEIASTCTTVSCSSTCKSLLNAFKNEIGCCLESYGDSYGYRAFRIYVDGVFEFCGISPPGRCNHASSVVITSSTIAIFSILAYFVNHV